MNNINIGSIVYEIGSPQNPGIVIEIKPKPSQLVCIRWLKLTKNKQEWINNMYLNDLDILIEDHRKKLNTHETNRKLLLETEHYFENSDYCINCRILKENITPEAKCKGWIE